MGSAGVLFPDDVIVLTNTFTPDVEPIQLRRNSKFGYYIVASRFIKAEEFIVEDTPLMICPVGWTTDELICLTCFKICSSNCSICTWPVCGRNCEKGNIHSEYECKIFAEKKVLFKNPKHDYTAVKVLRCLLLRDKNPEKWDLFLQHDAQLYNRSKDVKCVEVRDHVLNFILEECQLKSHVDCHTLEVVLGICATNEFCLTVNEYSRHAFLLFHKIAYLTHSCEPNLETVWKFHPTQDSSYSQNYFSVKFYANRDIIPGEILTHSYMPETFSVVKRQNFLDGHYYFKCDCERCRRELFTEICPYELNIIYSGE